MSPSLWCFFWILSPQSFGFPSNPKYTYFIGLQLFLGHSSSSYHKFPEGDNCLAHLYIPCAWCTYFALNKCLWGWINTINDVTSVCFLLFSPNIFFCASTCIFMDFLIRTYHFDTKCLPSSVKSGFKNKQDTTLHCIPITGSVLQATISLSWQPLGLMYQWGHTTRSNPP